MKDNNDAIGYHGSVLYGGSKLLRGSLEYTYYRKINIEPTWYNIKASTIEFNIHIMTKFKKSKTYFYPLVGLSYNSFSGYFTGKDDFQNLHDKYQKNQIAVTKWIGVNVGAGFEKYFIKRASVYGEYKMRVGNSQEKQINIMDVCFSIGVRGYLRVPSIYKLVSTTKSRYPFESKEPED
ncbi:MAG: hypothetical protein H0U95_17100 [Bacteroidetes bacterium]|nr:hypothetical protein [Bacteroidota bacterium]